MCSVDQNAGKLNVHKFQELANQDEAADSCHGRVSGINKICIS